MSAAPLVNWNLCPIYRLRMDREPVAAVPQSEAARSEVHRS